MRGHGIAALAASGLVLLFLCAERGGASDSAHDFRGDGLEPDGGCILCHVAGASSSTAPQRALWDTRASVDSFPGFDGTGSTTRLCLSCHDGTVANSIPASKMGGGPDGRTGSPYSDPGRDHPVSVRYDGTRTSLRSSSAPSGLGGTIASDLLVDGKVECASCHDMHAGGPTADGRPSLRMDNRGSTLCLTCHVK